VSILQTHLYIMRYMFVYTHMYIHVQMYVYTHTFTHSRTLPERTGIAHMHIPAYINTPELTCTYMHISERTGIAYAGREA
jgi:hypothetical protein